MASSTAASSPVGVSACATGAYSGLSRLISAEYAAKRTYARHPPNLIIGGEEHWDSQESESEADNSSAESDAAGENDDGGWTDVRAQAKRKARELLKEASQLAKELVPVLKVCL